MDYVVICCSHGHLSGFHFLTGAEKVKSLGYWQPQDPCPVPGCLRKRFHSRKQFSSHWREKHEKVVMMYICPYCSRGQKRRRDVIRHALTSHGANVDLAALSEEFQINQQYVFPGTVTLQQILGPDVTVSKHVE